MLVHTNVRILLRWNGDRLVAQRTAWCNTVVLALIIFWALVVVDAKVTATEVSAAMLALKREKVDKVAGWR